VVLAADTVVVLDGTILGKPGDDAEATAMLEALRGRAHRVLTGVALAVAGEIAWSSVVETTVWMRAYSAHEVERYVRCAPRGASLHP
jgi:septum formation protein